MNRVGSILRLLNLTVATVLRVLGEIGIIIRFRFFLMLDSVAHGGVPSTCVCSVASWGLASACYLLLLKVDNKTGFLLLFCLQHDISIDIIVPVGRIIKP